LEVVEEKIKVNIFFLSNDAYESAKMQCDKHVVKMILESAQILSTTHRIIDGNESGVLPDYRNEEFYRITHKNHPSVIWARKSVSNHNWLVDHFDGLLQEYTHRYKKKHKTGRLLYDLQSPPSGLTDWDWTTPPCCMPDEYKISSYVDNYREYYRKAKRHLHKWTNRDPPDWI
jgi:hypothetical protein